MKIQVQEIINWWICIWTIIKKWSLYTQFEVTAGYSYQDFRDISDGFHTIWKRHYCWWRASAFSRKSSVIARTNISIADKYLLTLSYRRDGTLDLQKQNLISGSCTSLEIEWRKFLKDFNVSALKLRGGCMGYWVSYPQYHCT
jgi:iron complex outermembrane receptor protein